MFSTTTPHTNSPSTQAIGTTTSSSAATPPAPLQFSDLSSKRARLADLKAQEQALEAEILAEETAAREQELKKEISETAKEYADALTEEMKIFVAMQDTASKLRESHQKQKAFRAKLQTMIHEHGAGSMTEHAQKNPDLYPAQIGDLISEVNAHCATTRDAYKDLFGLSDPRDITKHSANSTSSASASPRLHNNQPS